jgi:hydroxyacylglutathione hydrolase
LILERIKSEGLAHNSYFIGSQSQAVVIDPRRDCQVYIDLAQKHEMKIRYIFETHRNEDYTVGSSELRSITGADIYHGPGLPWNYGITLIDGQTFRIGTVELKAIHTPGHTDESMSYVLTDLPTGKAPVILFSGDALFVGDAGRTDLYGSEEADRLASSLYDSLFHKILPLGDGVILCPAHGAGSVCGGHIADRDESTIGIEKVQNQVLQLKDKSEFIKYKTGEKHERPYYFRQMEKYNLEGPPILGYLTVPQPMTVSEFQKEIQDGAIVVDTREPAAFGGTHIKDAYSIWLNGLPIFAGWVLGYDKPVLLVLEDEEHLATAVNYLIRIGYDNIKGYLKGGTQAWYNAGLPMEDLSLLSVYKLKDMIDRGDDFMILDTREDNEWQNGHVEGAYHIYVGQLEKRLSEVPRDKPIAVMCKTGHRASLAASILLRAGYKNIFNVLGSIMAWTANGFPIVKE